MTRQATARELAVELRASTFDELVLLIEESGRSPEEKATLLAALADRATVEQAKGILMASYGVAPDRALDWLCRLAEKRDIEVRVLAMLLVQSASHDPDPHQADPSAPTDAPNGGADGSPRDLAGEGALLAAQLQSALSSRIVIEQAKGALAHIHGISTDAALSRLRAYCMVHGRSLSEIAAAVITDPASVRDLTSAGGSVPRPRQG